MVIFHEMKSRINGWLLYSFTDFVYIDLMDFCNIRDTTAKIVYFIILDVIKYLTNLHYFFLF